jgi:ribosome-associated protein
MDYFIICTGEVNTHVRAIINHIEKEIRKELRDRALYREGYESLNWVLLDYVDVVVHVFRPSFRDYYRLEDLWSDAERVDIATEADLKLLTAPKKKPTRARARKTKTASASSRTTE